MVDSNSSSIEKELRGLNFSRNASLSQLVTDWPRVKNIVYINNQPLSILFEKIGLDSTDLDASDLNMLNKFKQLLSLLVPKDVVPTDLIYDQLASVLHQGGLPFRLETEVSSLLTENGRMLDNVKQGMSRRVDLVSTDSGISVREIFIYKGNISKRDPDNPEFVQSQGLPMLSGKCEYLVQVDGTQVRPQFQNMLLSTGEPTLDTLLKSNVQKVDTITINKEPSLKEKLAEIKSTGNKDIVSESKNYKKI